jgi:hypothetical protein
MTSGPPTIEWRCGMFDLCHPGNFPAAAIFRDHDSQVFRACEEDFLDAKTQEVQRRWSRGRAKVPQFFRIILEFLGYPECNSLCVSFRCHTPRRTTASRPVRATHGFMQTHLSRTPLAGVTGVTDDRHPRFNVQAAQSSLVKPTASRAATRSAGSSSPASNAQSIQMLPGSLRSVGLALPCPDSCWRRIPAR